VLVIAGPAASGAPDADEQRLVNEARADTVIRDPDGTETRRLGAATSGHIMVFSPNGRRLFTGGITPMQGHRGACDGLERLDALLRGAMPAGSGGTRGHDDAASPTFGCAIFNACDALCGPRSITGAGDRKNPGSCAPSGQTELPSASQDSNP
jgi:hypothetical protein